MDILTWFLSCRTEALTVFFKVISLIAEETFIMAFVAIGYWCFNKKLYRDLAVLVCLSIMLNVLLKAVFKIPRPMIEPLVSINDLYSFPSGHAQITAVFWLVLAVYYKRPSMWGLAVFMIIAQCISRMYLGVHFFLDVFMGSLMGLITVIGYVMYHNSVYWPIFSKSKWAMALVFLGWILVYFLSMIDDLNANSIVAIGALAGVILGHILENNFCVYQNPINFVSKAVIAIVGMVLLLTMQYGLKIIPMSHGYFYYFGVYMVLGLQITFIFPLIVQLCYKKELRKPALTKCDKRF